MVLLKKKIETKKTRKDGDIEKPKRTRKKKKEDVINQRENNTTDAAVAPSNQQEKNITDAVAPKEKIITADAVIDQTTKKSKSKKRKAKEDSDDDEEEEDENENEKSSIESEEEKSSSESEKSSSEDEIFEHDKAYDSDRTNIKKEDNEGWIEKRRNFNVPRYGNAAMYIKKHFMTRDKKNFTYQTNKEKDAPLFVGKVISVVFNKKNEDYLHFKFHSVNEPTIFGYYPCEHFMCAKSKSHVTFINRVEDATATKNSTKTSALVLDGEGLVGRSIKKLFTLDDGTEQYFTGKIISYNKQTKEYIVNYNDGEQKPERQNTINECLRVD
jgi:hypothetical protein